MQTLVDPSPAIAAPSSAAPASRDAFLNLVAAEPGDAWQGLQNALTAFGCIVSVSIKAPKEPRPASKKSVRKRSAEDDPEPGRETTLQTALRRENSHLESAGPGAFDWRRRELELLARLPEETLHIEDPAGRAAKDWKDWLQRAAVLQLKLEKLRAGDVCFQAPIAFAARQYRITVSGETFPYQLFRAYKPLLNRYAPRDRRVPIEWQDVVRRFWRILSAYDPRHAAGLAGYVKKRGILYQRLVGGHIAEELGARPRNPSLFPISVSPADEDDRPGGSATVSTGDDTPAEDWDNIDHLAWAAGTSGGYVSLLSSLEQDITAEDAAEETRRLLAVVERHLFSKREREVWSRIRSLSGPSPEAYRAVGEQLGLHEKTIARCFDAICERVRIAYQRGKATPSAQSPRRCLDSYRRLDRTRNVLPRWRSSRFDSESQREWRVAERDAQTRRKTHGDECVLRKDELGNVQRRGQVNGGQPYWLVDFQRRPSAYRDLLVPASCAECQAVPPASACHVPLAPFAPQVTRQGTGTGAARRRDHEGSVRVVDERTRNVHDFLLGSSRGGYPGLLPPAVPGSPYRLALRCEKPVLRGGLLIPEGCGGGRPVYLRHEAALAVCPCCGWHTPLAEPTRDEHEHVCAGIVCTLYPSCTQRRIDRDMTSRFPYTTGGDKLDKSFAREFFPRRKKATADTVQEEDADLSVRLQGGMARILSDGGRACTIY